MNWPKLSAVQVLLQTELVPVFRAHSPIG